MNSTSDIVDTLGNASAYLSTISTSTGFEHTPIIFVDNVTKLNAENLNTLTASIGEIQEHIKDNDSIASTLSGYLNTIVSYLSVNEGQYYDLIVSTTEDVTKEILQGDTIDDYINIKVIQAKNAESAASASVAHRLSSEAVIDISQINWTDKPDEAMRNLGILPFRYDNTDHRFETGYDICFDGDISAEGSFNIDTLNISSSLTFQNKALINAKTGNIALADKAAKADEADKLSGKTRISIDLTDQSIPDDKFYGDETLYIPELVGQLPIHRGGTGADTAEGARANLDITPENIGAVSNCEYDTNFSNGTLTGDIRDLLKDRLTTHFNAMSVNTVKMIKINIKGRVFDVTISRTVNNWGHAVVTGYNITDFKIIRHSGDTGQWEAFVDVCTPIVVSDLPTDLTPYSEGTIFFQVLDN